MPADGMIISVEYDQRQLAAVDAIEGLFCTEAPNVWRSVLAYSGGRREIADEAVAEAFARAIAYEGRIRRPVAWLYQVAFRLAAAEMRRQQREDAETVEVAVDPPEVVGVFEALRQLSPNQRAAVVMFHEVRYAGERDRRQDGHQRRDRPRPPAQGSQAAAANPGRRGGVTGCRSSGSGLCGRFPA